MTVQPYNWAKSVYRKVVTSLGFWPTVTALIYAAAATLLLWLDTGKITTSLLETVPALVIRDGDTARVILSTLVGGMVSLTVFSFTMVMSQLNRAATNYSPRLLPGLISTRRHQVVLGTFLGAITFCLIVLITIQPSADTYELPGLAILTAVGLSIGCLGTFVYFIHSISQAIQVSNILQRIADQSSYRLGLLGQREERNQRRPKPDYPVAETVVSRMTGYFQNCNPGTLEKIAVDHDLIIEVCPRQGEFVLEHTDLFRLNKKPGDEVIKEILSCFEFSNSGFVQENYVLGFKQITEIAVRAMSPGTNDPGTALSAIHHLTHLLSLRMRFDDEEVHFDKDDNPRVIVSVVSFGDLIYQHFASLRLYCKHDIIIVLELLRTFRYLLQQPAGVPGHREILENERNILLADARESITTEADLAKLESCSGPS